MTAPSASEGPLHTTLIVIFLGIFVGGGSLLAAIYLTLRTRKKKLQLEKDNDALEEKIKKVEKETFGYKEKYERLKEKKASEGGGLTNVYGSQKSTKSSVSSQLELSEKGYPSKKVMAGNDVPASSELKSGTEISDNYMEKRQNDLALKMVNSGEICLPAGQLRRSTDELIIDPMLPAEFTGYMRAACKLMVDYYNNPNQFCVISSQPQDFIFNSIPSESPLHPQDFSDLLKDLKELVMPGMTHWQHPQFLAYFPCGRTFPDILGEALCAALGAVGFSYDSCPAITEMECAMVNWVGRALGIPEGFLFQKNPARSQGGGCIMPSASDAIFCSVLASRDWKIKRIMKRKNMVIADEDKKHRSKNFDVMHAIASKLVVYTSVDAHSSIEKACKMAMVRCRSIQGKANNDYGITGHQLEKAVQRDIKAGLIPAHVHVTLGTTSSAACDHLETIWPVCSKYHLWLHVDSAYIGSSWIDPQYRANQKGLEYATSLNVNLNKFLLHSIPIAMFWTQDQKSYKTAFDVCPANRKQLYAEKVDLRNWGIHMSRPFRALKIWSVFRTYGIEGLRRSCNIRVDAAIYFESLLIKHPHVKMFGKRSLAMFCFQYYEPNFTKEDINKHTKDLAIFINHSKQIFLTRSVVSGNDIIRISVNFQTVNNTVIDETHEKLVNLIDQFKKEKYTMTKTPSREALAFGEFDHGVTKENTDNQHSIAENQTCWAETPLPITMVTSREISDEPWTQDPNVASLEKEAMTAREASKSKSEILKEKKSLSSCETPTATTLTAAKKKSESTTESMSPIPNRPNKEGDEKRES